MPSLGELLVAEGVCTARQIDDAAQNQVILGGRLGTNLLELGVVDEETLARALSRLHALPSMHGEEIAPDRQALCLLPPEAVDRLNLIPFEKKSSRLQVLCVDPGDLKALDELAFITGLHPDPIVVCELRFWQLLKRLYGIERQLRYVALDTRDYMAGSLSEEPAPAPPTVCEDLISQESFAKLYQRRDGFPNVPDMAAQEPPPDDLPILSEGDLEAVEEEPPSGPPGPIDRRVWAEGGRDEPAAAPATKQPGPERDDNPLDFGEATRLLAEVTGRDAIAHCVLRYARSVFRRAMLFTIHRGLALGWDAVGEGIDRGTLRNIMVPLDTPSVFQLVVTSRSHYLGGLSKTRVNVHFLRATGKKIPASASLIPILVRGRVVNIFYGDNGHRAHCPSDISDLLILAQRISQSYEALFEQRRAAYLASRKNP